MPAPVTSLWAALLAILYLGLTWRIILARRARQLDMGTGGEPLMERYVRGHGNFTETVPLALILLVLLELGGSPAWLLQSLGAGLLIGRLAHAWSFSFAELRLTSRTIGVLLSQGVIFLAALSLSIRLIWP